MLEYPDLNKSYELRVKVDVSDDRDNEEELAALAKQKQLLAD